MRKITYQQLVQLNACADQLALFKQTFGDSVVLTEEVAREYGHLFDVHWLVSRVLSAPLWKEYQEKRAPLWQEYLKKLDPLLPEYQEKRALLWEEYQEKRAPLLEAYDEKCALLFVQLYSKESV